MTANDKTSLPDLPDHMDKEVSQLQGNNTTPGQQNQFKLLQYHAFTSPVWATCADCGLKCGSVDYAFFVRPDESFCSAYLCGSCADSYRDRPEQEVNG